MARALLIMAIYLACLCGRGFWDPDEPRFAQVAREMLQSGDWVVPHFDGLPLGLLPPLTYWASATASLPAGDITEWTARLPIVAFAVLAVAATMVLAARQPLLAGLVLLSSAKFLHQAQYLQADMLLVGSQSWALAALYRAWCGAPRRGLWLLSAYVALALAALAKGPLGVLLPGAVFFLFLLWQRELRSLGRMGLWWGVPLVAAIVLPWYAAACARAGEEFCHEILIKQNFGMFFDTWSHSQPFYYYAGQLPWMLLPWTLVAPSALWAAPRDRDTRFLVTWIAFAFVFFSASDAKQAKYLLPILPPLAVLIAGWLGDVRANKMLGVSAGFMALVFAAGAVAAPFVLPARLPGTSTGAMVTLGTGAALAAAAILMSRAPAGRQLLAPSLLAASLLAPALIAQWLLIPKVEPYKTPHALVEPALRLGHPLAIAGIAYRQTGGLIYYTGRELPLLESREDLDEYLADPEPRLAYVSEKIADDSYHVLAESPYRGGTVLVSNQREPRQREEGS